MSAGKRWTKEEDDFLKKHYKKKGSKYVADELNRTFKSVQKRALNINHTKFSIKRWNKNEISVLEKNHTKSIEELCLLLPDKPRDAILTKRSRIGLSSIKIYKWDKNDKILLKKHYANSDKKTIEDLFPNVKWNAIKEIARKIGIKRLTEYRKGDLSPLLKETNTAYYWIGFIMADGWISKEGQLVIGLSQKDKYHLEKLAILLKTEVKIINKTETIFFGKKYKRENIVRLTVQDKKLGLKLKNKMNISIKKTYNPPNLSFLNTNNKFMSFLAGFIDGDGSFSNAKCVSLKIQCHKNWLNNFIYIKNRLDNIINNNIRVFIDEKKYASLTTSNQTFLSKLKKFMIKLNIPIMDRKWDKIDINNISFVDKKVKK